MKRLKLTKVIASSLILASVLALNPIGASAQWKQDSNGSWNTEGDSWSVGWKEIDGKYYYFKTNGYMAHDTIIDGYKLGSDGTRTVTTSTEPTTNHSLAIVTNANYDSSINFSEGLAVVHNNSGFSYIDTNGNVKIGPITDKVFKENNGRGEIVSIKHQVKDASDFHEGLALLKDSKEVGNQIVIDTSGTEVIKGADIVGDSTMGSYMGGFSVAGMIGMYGGNVFLVDKNGKTTKLDTKKITGDDFNSASDICTDGLLLYRSQKEGKTGYINVLAQQVAIKPQFEDARIFNNGIAAAKLNGKWGFIDKNGTFVVQPQYDDFYVNDTNYSYQVFNSEIASVNKNGKWGGINKNGQVVVDFKYDNGFIFTNGIAVVKENGKYGYIDTQGKEIIGTQYDDANVFNNNNVALVGNNGTYYLIDKNGKKVSSETWNFEGTSVSDKAPDIISYKQNGKWGIATIK